MSSPVRFSAGGETGQLVHLADVRAVHVAQAPRRSGHARGARRPSTHRRACRAAAACGSRRSLARRLAGRAAPRSSPAPRQSARGPRHRCRSSAPRPPRRFRAAVPVQRRATLGADLGRHGVRPGHDLDLFAQRPEVISRRRVLETHLPRRRKSAKTAAVLSRRDRRLGMLARGGHGASCRSIRFFLSVGWPAGAGGLNMRLQLSLERVRLIAGPALRAAGTRATTPRGDQRTSWPPRAPRTGGKAPREPRRAAPRARRDPDPFAMRGRNSRARARHAEPMKSPLASRHRHG